MRSSVQPPSRQNAPDKEKLKTGRSGPPFCFPPASDAFEDGGDSEHPAAVAISMLTVAVRVSDNEPN